MNFALMVSTKVEEQLDLVERGAEWSQADEGREYERCLKEVLEENGRAWADGNIRVGDYILLGELSKLNNINVNVSSAPLANLSAVDSDTRVPADCLLEAASEMERSPEVGIMQYSSGVMQVVHNYFENGITFFTNLIYTAIRYIVC